MYEPIILAVCPVETHLSARKLTSAPGGLVAVPFPLCSTRSDGSLKWIAGERTLRSGLVIPTAKVRLKIWFCVWHS